MGFPTGNKSLLRAMGSQKKYDVRYEYSMGSAVVAHVTSNVNKPFASSNPPRMIVLSESAPNSTSSRTVCLPQSPQYNFEQSIHILNVVSDKLKN